ncbi:HD domain-containing protein [Alkalicoccobacillus porphyridii]|uniref:HD domain-containing protein n=1 Tax=Alkalicoccobacillus porphyridii TaxID=2597270 RepID=A0A553ZTC9_9BACI|nr:HD domain-containing protein [Alkalicoccobacillus porphyridii]TSB44731.1 HD domain-containing protein [Alkalicoccobacillus porphyridii]
MSNSIHELAAKWVQEQLADDLTGHDWYHIKRVTALGRYLLKGTEANSNVVILSCLLHDLADDKVVESEEAGRQLIVEWLITHHVAQDTIDHIISIISTMSFKGGNGVPMETIEGQIVQDADRLDALGAIGIARTFTYSGHKQQAMYNPELSTRENMSVSEYRQGTSSAVHHFYEKLFKLPELMNTQKARILANERADFMKKYLEQFYSEWSFEA